ncbi:MAG TPA: hypothetical protein VGL00_01790, partial [Terracidiphilus sp.]
DSAIVVIQSGLTTHAQLREIAKSLQRLDVAAVGFVINRVSISKADAAFRRSLRAVEQHLAVRNRLRPHELRPSPKLASTPEPSLVSKTDAVKQPADNSSPDSLPEAAAAEQLGPAPAAPITAPAAVAESNSAPPSRVARGRGEPARRPAAAASPKSTPAATRRSAPVRPPSSKVAAPSSIQSSGPPAPDLAPPAVPSASLAPPVSRAADRSIPPLPAFPPVAIDPLADDLPPEQDDRYATSRLGGLRNLLVSLGRRSLNRDDHPAADSHSDIEPRFDRATVRNSYPETPLPAADGAPNRSPGQLTAQPEFLPPRPSVEAEKDGAEKEREVAVRPTPPRRETPDGEEIQTLPSWRGQYRKKRYPPM